MDDVQLTADGKTMIYTEQTESRPTEIFRVSSSGGSPVAMTKLNDALLSQYSLPRAEDFWVETSDGAKVQSFLFKPPDFDPQKKYPALMLIHGGPQGFWGPDQEPAPHVKARGWTTQWPSSIRTMTLASRTTSHLA